jgi:indole-3-glycerol phosphate synthase
MLNKIIATKKEEIELLTLPPQQDVKPISFLEALKNYTKSIGLIAEVKKASPSKGVIKEDFHPLSIAQGYERGGADAISVLTDRQYFQGASEYLTLIKKEINLPVLRKDFIIENIQIDESKRIGADAILLIAEALEPQKLYELYEYAYENGLDVLVEVHAADSLENILKLFTPKIVGVNNRNLKTFETSLLQTKQISALIPQESIFVSESGIHSKGDLAYVSEAGASAVLVGESLMRAETPEKGIKQLFNGMVEL